MPQVSIKKGEKVTVSDCVGNCIMDENYGGIAKELPKLPESVTKAKAKAKAEK